MRSVSLKDANDPELQSSGAQLLQKLWNEGKHVEADQVNRRGRQLGGAERVAQIEENRADGFGRHGAIRF